MYYHLIIEHKTSEIKTQYLFDNQNLDQIKADYAVPYKQNQTMIVNGYNFERKDVVRFCIKESNRSAQEVTDEKKQQALHKGRYPGWKREDVIKNDSIFKDITKAVLDSIELSSIAQEKINTDSTKVFIVHGHNNEIKLDVARFLEQIKLQAVILHEQTNAGKTIIEKLEKYSDVGYAIVLYSPCDIGKENKEEDELHPRARQNVVFEHGYLLGKLGRDRVCALVKPNIEKPSDTDGITYIEYDSGNWKIQIAKELKEVGYNVDMNLL
jgi:predicted nucleotide-binding protein